MNKWYGTFVSTIFYRKKKEVIDVYDDDRVKRKTEEITYQLPHTVMLNGIKTKKKRIQWESHCEIWSVAYKLFFSEDYVRRK